VVCVRCRGVLFRNNQTKHCIIQVLLMRMNLPLMYRKAITEVLGPPHALLESEFPS